METESPNAASPSFLDRMFRLRENNTRVRTEILAGVTIFTAISYILAVNPNILGAAGMPAGGVFIATALAAALGTAFMALFANYPFMLMPGMGLNAYFAFTVVLGMGYSWKIALFAVFIEGLIFLLLSAVKIREKIFNSIPLVLKKSVSAGIGLFIAFIALQNCKLIGDNPATLVSLHDFSSLGMSSLCAILALGGTVITAILLHFKVRGAILLGIFITWGIGIVLQLAGIYQVNPEQKFFSLLPALSCDTVLQSIGQSFKEFGAVCGALFDTDGWTLRGTEAVGFDLAKSLKFAVVVFAFLFVDLFDTLGTLIGVATRSDMLDENGYLPRLKGALYADSLATTCGAVLGTSTVTTVVESATGVAEGGRTGLTALTGSLLFLLAIPFAPIFLAIPSFATAPALIIVGFYMMMSVASVDFEDIKDSVPAFLCMIFMPLAYSIADGIAVGIVSWTLVNLFTGNAKRISVIMYVLTVLFVCRYIFL